MKKHYLSKDELPCPKGWTCEAWEVDTSGKVDKDGENVMYKQIEGVYCVYNDKDETGSSSS